MTFASAHSAPAFLSRRSLLELLALSPVPLLASCKGSVPYAGSDDQINRVIQAYNDIVRREPNLPGVRSLARLNPNLAAGFSESDLSLLASALHLQARQHLGAADRPIGETAVRAALSKPIDISPYNRPFFERTLAQAKTRAAQDFVYRQELEGISNQRLWIGPSQGGYYCIDRNGEPIPDWLCSCIPMLIIHFG